MARYATTVHARQVPCILCGAATPPPDNEQAHNRGQCSLCSAVPAGETARERAAAALWLLVLPGARFDLIAGLLGDIAAETGSLAFTDTEVSGPVAERFGWLDAAALRPVVNDAVSAWNLERVAVFRGMERRGLGGLAW